MLLSCRPTEKPLIARGIELLMTLTITNTLINTESDLEQKATDLALDNILYATDFSAACDNAWSYALAIAKQYGSTLFMAHVISPTAFASVPQELLPIAQSRTIAHAEQQLQHLRRLHGGTGKLDFYLLLSQGNVADVLLGLGRQHRADLMVLGTRGHRHLDRLLLGSVAEKVFRQATCPVLVVPDRAGSSDTIPVDRILYPTDFSPESLEAWKYASSLARHFQAELILLHVLPNGQSRSTESLRRDRLAIKDRLHDLIQSDRESLDKARIEVASGEPARIISRTAAEFQADLLVLGVHRRSARAAHEQERTAYTVIRNSHCPVLTISKPRALGYAS